MAVAPLVKVTVNLPPDTELAGYWLWFETTLDAGFVCFAADFGLLMTRHVTFLETVVPSVAVAETEIVLSTYSVASVMEAG